MNYRNHHLSFCRICKNRKLSIQEGVVCKLTNQKANFKKTCIDFDFDNVELLKIKKYFNEQISEHATSSAEGLLIRTRFYKFDTKSAGKYFSAEQTHGLKFEKSYKIYLTLKC